MFDDIQNERLQVFTSDVTIVKPIGEITLLRFLQAIGEMKPELLSIYKKIQKAELDNDIKLKGELKRKLFYFIPAVKLNPKGRRSYKDIIHFTGLMHLDFDHIENAKEFKTYIFQKYDFIIAAWISSSGKGVKCLVKIPVVKTVDEYKSYFWGLTNIVMNKYKGFDTAPQNCVLPLFLSPDSEILVAGEFTTWETKGLNPKDIAPQIMPFKHNPNFDTKYYKWAISNTKKAIDNIVDNGHPQLRAISFSLGGYVGAGYIKHGEAVNLINKLIDSNNYLSKKANVYKKTAITMINKGQLMPLYFKN